MENLSCLTPALVLLPLIRAMEYFPASRYCLLGLLLCLPGLYCCLPVLYYCLPGLYYYVSNSVILCLPGLYCCLPCLYYFLPGLYSMYQGYTIVYPRVILLRLPWPHYHYEVPYYSPGLIHTISKGHTTVRKDHTAISYSCILHLY